MTITPRFHLTQTDTAVELSIRVPHVRVTVESIQVVVVDDDAVLHFSSPPYLLILRFAPHRFHQDAAAACASYEPLIEHGTICLSLRKAQPGPWENLDLLGQWNKPLSRGTTGVRWLRQVQDNNHGSPESEKVNHATVDMDETTESVRVDGYGFLRLYHGIYADLTRDGLAQEMLEMPWIEEPSMIRLPSDTNIHRGRRVQRKEMEFEKFHADRYRQDLDIHEDYIYQCAMSYPPHWRERSHPEDTLAEELSKLSLQKNENSFFTDQERQELMAIPYPLLPSTITVEHVEGLCAGLVDLMFAYVYDHLTTAGDPTVESAWAISTLSASLSCLDDWLEEIDADARLYSVGHSCLRRSLIYPYLRNFGFGIHCLEQVRQICAQGVRCVIRCLLQMRTILNVSELYYLGNKLWIDPYLAWLQRDTARAEHMLHAQSRRWPSSWSKGRVGLGLVELESQFTGASSSDDDDDDDESDESDGSSSDASSSSENSDKDDEEEGCSLEKKNQRGKIPCPDLLDGSLGQSILQVSQAESTTTVLPTKPRRPLIEEVE